MKLTRTLLVVASFVFPCVTASAGQLYVACSFAARGTVGTYSAITKYDFESGDPVAVGVGGSYDVFGNYAANGLTFDQPYYEFLERSVKTEIDAAFSFPISDRGGCATAYITAQAAYAETASYEADRVCYAPTVCRLALVVDSGGSITMGDATGDYDCQACVTLAAFPYDGWEFVGWTTDASGTNPVTSVCMLGRDRVVGATFRPIPPPPPPDLNQCSDYNYTAPCSPIVINFANCDYQLTGRNAPVLFDIAANGHPRSIGWTAAGADEAFLWLDRNGNGIVDNGAELFGTATRLKNGTFATNGFEALRELDSNGDSVINAHDAAWPQLMLWRDLNHDGRSDPSEIMPIASSGVVALGLPYRWTGRVDLWGNAFRYESVVWLEDERGHMRVKPLYDIFFVTVP